MKEKIKENKTFKVNIKCNICFCKLSSLNKLKKHEQSKQHKLNAVNKGKPIFKKLFKKKFDIILADPPWQYNGRPGFGVVAKHYKTMSDFELMNLPVKSQLANENCALFLWVTSPRLSIGLKTMKAWGFDYKTVAFSWVKTHRKGENDEHGKVVKSIGHYTRPGVELCLLGVRGHVLQWKGDSSVSQVIISERREHSRKPDEVRDSIDQLFRSDLKLRKIELFARQSSPGWKCWGNEINKFDEE